MALVLVRKMRSLETIEGNCIFNSKTSFNFVERWSTLMFGPQFKKNKQKNKQIPNRQEILRFCKI